VSNASAMANGFPRQKWMADVGTAEFEAEAHRQSAAVADSERAADDQAFIDALSVDMPA